MNPAHRSPALFVGLSIFFTFFLSGCGALVTYEVSQREHVRAATDLKPDLAQDRFLVDMAKRYGLMALFAQTAYRKDLKVEERDDKACDYLYASKPGAQTAALMHMPRSPDGKGGWVRYQLASPMPKGDPGQPCVNTGNGLFYETYVHKAADGNVTKAVIAFRGTENRSGQWFWDWKTNLTAAFGFEPAQYQYVRERLPALIEALKRDLGPAIKIYAVGHSLGGGLAQLAAYASKDVEEAYIFNASPVTGWTWVAKDGKDGRAFQPYPRIHRITQGGEALEVPRFAASLVTNPRFGRHDVRIHFDDTVEEKRGDHSMQLLACGFAELLLKKDAADAEHDYPLQFIADNVLASALVQGMKPSQAWEMSPGATSRVCDIKK